VVNIHNKSNKLCIRLVAWTIKIPPHSQLWIERGQHPEITTPGTSPVASLGDAPIEENLVSRPNLRCAEDREDWVAKFLELGSLNDVYTIHAVDIQ
jgi:hypothetical protein